MFEKFFNLSENNTNTRTELLAGLTTFLTMSYIIFVQPAVLSKDFAGQATGLDPAAILLATCLISAISCIFMGLYARYPIALAPGMGENFFFISVIMSLTSLGFQNPWKVALGIVFISGILFLIISVLNVRKVIIDSISLSLRNGIAVGIGLFITFIGLRNGGIITGNQGTLVSVTDKLISIDVGVCIMGLITIASFYTRKVRGAILWGIIVTSLLALLFDKITFTGFFGFPDIKQHSAFQMDIKSALSLTCLPFIIIFIIHGFF